MCICRVTYSPHFLQHHLLVQGVEELHRCPPSPHLEGGGSYFHQSEGHHLFASNFNFCGHPPFPFSKPQMLPSPSLLQASYHVLLHLVVLLVSFVRHNDCNHTFSSSRMQKIVNAHFLKKQSRIF